jgi:hypothetical protein
MDIVCQPLKVASMCGAFMSNSLGRIHCCFTPITAYIIDTPEATLITSVGGKTSHLTLASHKHFGDHLHHLTYLAIFTLSQLECLAKEVDPWDLELYAKNPECVSD